MKDYTYTIFDDRSRFYTGFLSPRIRGVVLNPKGWKVN